MGSTFDQIQPSLEAGPRLEGRMQQGRVRADSVGPLEWLAPMFAEGTMVPTWKVDSLEAVDIAGSADQGNAQVERRSIRAEFPSAVTVHIDQAPKEARTTAGIAARWVEAVEENFGSKTDAKDSDSKAVIEFVVDNSRTYSCCRTAVDYSLLATVETKT